MYGRMNRGSLMLRAEQVGEFVCLLEKWSAVLPRSSLPMDKVLAWPGWSRRWAEELRRRVGEGGLVDVTRCVKELGNMSDDTLKEVTQPDMDPADHVFAAMVNMTVEKHEVEEQTRKALTKASSTSALFYRHNYMMRIFTPIDQ